jgi:Omp85 superfamily domain
MQLIRLCLALVLAAGTPIPAVAQADAPATRAEALRQEREKKQQALRPNLPDTLQRGMGYVEDRALFLIARDGFHPKLGSLTTGSGFAYGIGFRDRDLFRKRARLELFTAASVKKYWAIEARLTAPDRPDSRLVGDVVGSLREYPEEEYFGLGPDSQRDDRTSFLLRTAQFAARGGLRLVPNLTVGGGLGFVAPHTGAGKNSDVPTTDELFDASTAPGLGVDTDFLRSSAFVVMDYREPLNARRGGWYRFEVARHSDRNDGSWSFTRTDLDLRQFIGMLADRRVLALRGLVSSTWAADDSNGVPFFLMPSLGGNDSLRGFRSYRFRGPHALLLQAEYRWEIWSGLDGAFFYDAGKVALQRSELGLKNLEDDYGLGFRFNTDNGVILRVDAAFGSREGKHLHIVFGGVF